MILTLEHETLRAQIRAFAEAEVAPRVEAMESSGSDGGLAALIAQQGWIGVTIPTQYGGMEAGHVARVILIEELSRISAAAGAITQASILGLAKILHFGNAEQQQRWLPAIAAGECLPTIAVTERVSGSHVLGMQSTGKRSRRHWVINGRKAFVGNSHVGHLHGVVVRTRKGSKGLTAFLVEADRPGVTLVPHRRSMGLHGFTFGELVFDNVRVPKANLLGDVGDGLAVAYSSSVLYGRPNLSAVSLGIHQATLDAVVPFVQGRPRYGGTLADIPVVQARVGQIQQALMTARTLLYDAAVRLDRGLACDPELMNAKYVGAASAEDSTRAAMRIAGAAGLFSDLPFERLLRDAQHMEAPAGTGDIQIHRLACEALGISDETQWSQRFAHVLARRAMPLEARAS
ncbi:acyl-CoA dehydrogenase family protein [Streptomyces sp. SID1121]|uniref:acyl-CoA dehydrogenase family protein n=1 Tax=Streptomyces sp. SID1121 TaxID=3425888 RepID=UPI004056C7BA